VVDLFLLPPPLCFLEPVSALAKSATRSEVLASAYYCARGCLAHCMRYNTQALEHIERMLDKVAHMTFDTYRECSPQFQFCAILHLLLLLRSSIIALRVIHVLLVSINRYGFLTLLASNKRGRQPAQLSLRLFWKHLTKDSV
jgi:hypothetical protein